MGITAFAAPALGILLQVAAGSVDLEVRASPEVSQCPSPEQVRGALTRQLHLAGGAVGGWTLRYLPTETLATALAVEVTDATGGVRAQRRVELARSNCVATAEILAAIVVRAAQPIEWTPAPATVTAAVPEVSPARVPPRLSVLVGPAFVSGPTPGGNVLLAISGRFSQRLGWWTGGLLIPAHSQQSVGQTGTARLTRSTLLGGGTWTGALAALELQVGPLLALSFDEGRTQGVTVPDSGRRAVLAGGALTGVSVALGRRWRVGAVGAVLGRLAGSEFAVIADRGELLTLRPPPLSVLAALHLQAVIFP